MSLSKSWSSRLMGMTLLLAPVIAPTSLPQACAQPMGGGGPGQENVYVRDSALALEQFALAQRMEGQQWNTAAQVYNEILEKYADRVVPSQKDAAGRVY